MPGLLREVPGFGVFEVEEGAGYDWTIRMTDEAGDATMLEEARRRSSVLHSFDLEIDHSHCCLGRDGESYTVCIWSDLRGSDRLTAVCRPDGTALMSATDNMGWLRFALWMVFTLFATPKGMTPIHASTVVWHGKAVLCLGESGTGKSTHTRLWLDNIEGSRLLNDDSPILCPTAAETMVYGSPWSGKTPCYHNVGAPVAAIVRLSQAPYNKIERLGTIQALGALYPSCPPALAYDSGYTDHVVALLGNVIQHTPIYHLECLPDKDAATLCRDTVFGKV
ncbi:MAG: hypothetical protein IJU81_00600 [Bacteroidales bacterium]|nr:hypothetical protein [Bacteroidales bacterium]